MNNNYYSGGVPRAAAGMPNQYMGMGNPYAGNMQTGYMQQNMRMSSNGALPTGWILNARYTIMNVLGKGAFSFVYLAFDGYSQSYVAIKELYVPGLCSRRTGSCIVEIVSPESQQQFGYLMARYPEEYAAVTSMADEPRVVSYFDLFYENNTAYIVMEYIQGMSVRNMVEGSGGSLNPIQVQQIMKEILTGLSSIHASGYLHRDIKPENVIITQDDSIKIIDFGAARISDKAQDDSELKYDKVFTQGYAPPEQFADSRRQGPETDVYAAGALCYYMLSGQVPYPSMDRKISSYDPLKPLEMIRNDIPQYMIKAVNRAMELKPELRFQSANDFSRCLSGKRRVKSAKQVKRSKLLRRTTFAAAIIAVLAYAASVAIERLMPNPVREMITGDVSLAVMIPVDSDPANAEAQRAMWEGISSDFSSFVQDKSGHSIELEMTFATIGDEYIHELELYTAQNTGAVVAVRDDRYMPGVQLDNCLPDLSLLVTPTSEILGFTMDEETTSAPVSFDMLVMYTNEKLLSGANWQGDLPDTADQIAGIQVGEDIAPLMVDELLEDEYSYAAAYSTDPIGDFCAGKAMCYIGFASDADKIEQELPGYCTISSLPELSRIGQVYAREWGVTGEAKALELNAAQVFIAYISGENAQETLCVRNNGGFPANINALEKYLDYYPRFERVFNED